MLLHTDENVFSAADTPLERDLVLEARIDVKQPLRVVGIDQHGQPIKETICFLNRQVGD